MIENNSDKAFEICSKLIENEKVIRNKMIENIPLYSEIMEEEYYKVYLGDENATLAMFLGLPEVTRARSQVRSWVIIQKNLVDNFGMKFADILDIPLSKLVIIALFAGDKEKAEDLISKARTLLPSEWREIEGKLKGRPVFDDGHRHEFKHYKQCVKCGEKEVEK